MANEGTLSNRPSSGLNRRLLAPLLAAVAVLGVIAFVAFGLTQGGETLPASKAGGGNLAPDFKVSLLDGDSFRLSEHRGKPTVVNFWFVNCPGCRLEMSAFQKTWKEFKDRGLVIIGVNPFDNAAKARAFVEEIGATYPIGLDKNQETLLKYKVLFFPTTVFIDRDGNITRTHSSYLAGDLFRTYVKEILQ